MVVEELNTLNTLNDISSQAAKHPPCPSQSGFGTFCCLNHEAVFGMSSWVLGGALLFGYPYSLLQDPTHDNIQGEAYRAKT